MCEKAHVLQQIPRTEGIQNWAPRVALFNPKSPIEILLCSGDPKRKDTVVGQFETIDSW